jgi:class 3 adenylate cyclase
MLQEKPPHILIIDDDWMNREVMEAHLHTESYEVTTTHSGSEGFKLALSLLPDLVLLDAMIPDMNGFEVCAKLKNNPTTRFIPVVMVTALESDEHKLKAIEAGVDDYITKPFSFLLMLRRVKTLIRMKRLYDELEESNRILRRVLNRYVDEDIVDVILIDPERYLAPGGETRTVTIVFADISGFTAYAEQHSAQKVISTLNQIFTELTALVFQHHGTFDKYIGDEIMAFFGAPVSTGDDTLNAVMMAWNMQQAFATLRQKLNSDLMNLSLEIGVHKGEVVVGNVGSDRVMNYTVIGDSVNIARRLQEMAHNGQILISSSVYDEVKDRITVAKLQTQPLTGKSKTTGIYQLTGVKP